MTQKLEKNNAYAYSLVNKQYKKGKDGTKNSKKVIQINFVKRFSKVGHLEGTNELSDIIKQKKLGENELEIKVIYLEKYRRILYNENIKELELWLSLLGAKKQSDIELIKKEVKKKKYKVLKEMIKVIEEFQSEEYVQELFWREIEEKNRFERKMKEEYERGTNRKNYWRNK